MLRETASRAWVTWPCREDPSFDAATANCRLVPVEAFSHAGALVVLPRRPQIDTLLTALPKKRCLELSSLNKCWRAPESSDTFFWTDSLCAFSRSRQGDAAPARYGLVHPLRSCRPDHRVRAAGAS